MNKKTSWIVGIIIVVVIILIWIFAGKSSPVTETSNSSASAPAPVTATAVRNTLQSLISSGATQTCTFSVATTATSSSLTGKIYMASKDMQGDYVTKNAAGKVTNAHMIITNGTLYLWSDTSNSKGIKVQWSSAASSTALADRAGVDVNQPTEYNCSNWTPDSAKFVIPTSIQFYDISKLVRPSVPVK